MFSRDALTDLSHLNKPSLRYMGTEDLILDLKLMSSIFQSQIHYLRMARECIIVGDPMLVRDHTSKCLCLNTR